MSSVRFRLVPPFQRISSLEVRRHPSKVNYAGSNPVWCSISPHMTFLSTKTANLYVSRSFFKCIRCSYHLTRNQAVAGSSPAQGSRALVAQLVERYYTSHCFLGHCVFLFLRGSTNGSAPQGGVGSSPTPESTTRRPAISEANAVPIPNEKYAGLPGTINTARLTSSWQRRFLFGLFMLTMPVRVRH